jgi:hypothetical protein
MIVGIQKFDMNYEPFYMCKCHGTVWKTRNDVVFNKKLLSSPQVIIIYKMLMLVIKTWRPLLMPKLKPMAEDMISLLSASAC